MFGDWANQSICQPSINKWTYNMGNSGYIWVNTFPLQDTLKHYTARVLTQLRNFAQASPKYPDLL